MVPITFGVQSTLGATPVLPPLADTLTVVANTLPVRYTEAGFCFLNKTVHFPSFGAIDWNFAGHGKLWTYNLNYFEYLRQPNIGPDVGEQLIGAWITEDTTHKDGWEPYPTSLRLVNWLQFYRRYSLAIPARVHTSIRRQYVDLWRKREYHLGGNHLLENAIALCLTARYLNDHKGQKKADRLLRAELKEQYLADGAHFELSVMYHLILLWRQLDLFSFLSTDDPLRQVLQVSLQSQLVFADSLITPDGRYPHFNDSTNDIGPDWKAVLAYAKALGFSRSSDVSFGLDASGEETTTTADTSDELSASFTGWKDASDERTSTSGIIRKDIDLIASPPTPPTSGSLQDHQTTRRPDHQTTLWIDAAQIGPTYIPGHAHADNLTFVLHCNGQPVVVDPGVSTYEKNDRRAWERSTAAHNTVVVNGHNSSDVWGGFRVGHRARTTILKDTAAEVVASHDGYGQTIHQRSFHFAKGCLLILDELNGEQLKGTAYLHFAPGLQPKIRGQSLLLGDLCFTFTGATGLELFNYHKAEGFNLLSDGVGAKVLFSAKLKTEINRTSGPGT